MGQGFTKGIPLDVDGTLSSNSDQLAPSQKAIKTYVDARATGTNTGDQTITLTGDVTGTGTGSFAASLDKTAITGKTTVTALGGDYVLISDSSDGGNLKKALASDFAGSGGVTDGDKGDITVSSSGTVWTIDNLAVTNAKINDVSVTKVTGTKAEFDTACSDGDFVYVGDAVLSPEGWTTIVKSANQDVTNNITPQDDTDLQFSVVAGGHYMVELNVCYSGNDTTGDYRFILELSTGLMRGTGHYITMNTAAAISTQLITASNTLATGTNAIGVFTANLDHLQALTIYFNFYVDSNATFKYKFANSSAAAGRTSRTWKGSILKYKRID